MTRATCASSPFIARGLAIIHGGRELRIQELPRIRYGFKSRVLSSGDREESEERERGRRDETAVRGWLGLEVRSFKSLLSLWRFVDLIVGQNAIDIQL